MLWQPFVLVAGAWLLGAAGWRAAGALGARDWVRVVAAAVLAAGAAAGGTLLLGAVSLAGAWWGHLGLAVVAFAATRRPAPPREPLPRPHPLALGVPLAVVVWQLARPWIGDDGLWYHLPIPLEWLQSGRAGERVDTVTGFPVGSYPLTHELLLAWALAQAGSLVPASLASPLLAALGAAALWAGLRELGVAPAVRAAAAAAAVTLPAQSAYLGQPGTDVAAWAWACCAFALAVAARGAPALGGVALLAAGLALGTKTTPALALVALLGWMLVRVRPPRAALAAGAAGALLVGGLWPLRNLVEHGSPLWPFVPAPWGDAMPPAMTPLRDRFLEHPVALLDAVGRGYATLAGGGPLLLAGAAVLGLGARRARPVAALALAAALLWSLAPFTGPANAPFVALLQVRYLLPAFTVAIVAIALAGRDRTATVLLGAAAAASLAWLADGFQVPHVPPAWVPAAGALAAPLLLALPRAALLAVPVALAVAADGYVARHAAAGPGSGGAVRAALAAPAWDGGGPIAAGPVGMAALAGDRLQHDVGFVDERTPCARLRRIAATGLLVLQVEVAPPLTGPMRRCLAGQAPVHADPRYVVWSR